MLSILRSGAAALACGVACLAGSALILMQIGISRYDNYEYYGQYPAMFVVPGIVGLFLPTVFKWVVRRGRSGNSDEDLSDR